MYGPGLIIGAAAVIVVLLIVYNVLRVGSILEMLERKVNTVLLIFAFPALIPLPPTIAEGILILIIWTLHKPSVELAPSDRSGS